MAEFVAPGGVRVSLPDGAAVPAGFTPDAASAEPVKRKPGRPRKAPADVSDEG